MEPQEENNIPNQADFKSNLMSVLSPLIFVTIVIVLMVVLAHYKGV